MAANSVRRLTSIEMELQSAMIKPKIFVGSSSEAKKAAEVFCSQLNRAANPVGWWRSDVFRGMFSTLDGLLEAIEKYDFGVFLLTPDDRIESRGRKEMSSRDNVLFEAGLFLGRLGRERIQIYVQDSAQRTKKVRMPSDLLGIHLPRFCGTKTRSVSEATLPFQRALRDYRKRDYLDCFGDRKDLGSLVLQGIKQSYYLELNSNLTRRPPIRVNIMVPIPNSRKRRIKILFVDDTQAFRRHELCAEWAPGEGKAGLAWSTREQQIYAHDSMRAKYGMQPMRGPKRTRLAKLCSVVSTPIFSPGGKQLCGVLNLDSRCEASMTDVTKPNVLNRLRQLADQLFPLLRT
jgi:CAP12/Pycsar effector protein, TIR domain